MRLEGMSMNNSSDTIGNRTSDLPGCSALSESNAPTCTTVVLNGVKYSRPVGLTQIKSLEIVYNSRRSLTNIQRKTIVLCITGVKTLAYDGLFRIND